MMISSVKVITTALLLFSQRSDAFFSVYDDYYSSPKYVIKYNDKDFYTNYESVKILKQSEKDNGSYHLMRAEDTDYLCHIPHLTLSEKLQPTLDDENRPEKIKEAFGKIKNALTDRWLYQQSGYWTYGFCFNKGLGQFNGQIQDFLDNKITKFMLGNFKKSDEADRYTLNKEGGLWYLRYNLEGGTLCDLTGRPRTAEIQFVCDPSQSEPALNWVKEYKSCQYQAQVAVPELCADDLLGSNKEEEIHQIECKKVVNTDIDVVDKEDYIKYSFQNHPRKISFSDYKLEPLGNGTFLGRSKVPDGLDVMIYNADEQDDHFLNNIAKAFFTGLSRKKIYDGQKLLQRNEEFTYFTYVYGRRGKFLSTVQILKKTNGEAIIYNRDDLSHLEANVQLNVKTQKTQEEDKKQQENDKVGEAGHLNQQQNSQEVQQEPHHPESHDQGQPQEQKVLKHDEL